MTRTPQTATMTSHNRNLACRPFSLRPGLPEAELLDPQILKLYRAAEDSLVRSQAPEESMLPRCVRHRSCPGWQSCASAAGCRLGVSRNIDTHLIVELLGASISWPGVTQNKLHLALGAAGLGDKGFRIPKMCSLKSARRVGSKSGQFLHEGATKTMTPSLRDL